MGNTEDQDEDESTQTQTQSFGADDAPPDDDDAPSSQGTAWGRLIPVPGPGFRGSGPVEITGDMWIGRGASCDMRITKQRVSTRHTNLRARAGGAVWCVDHSTNGTSVNGSRLSKGVETRLKGGDEISIAGTASYIFQPGSQPADGGGAAATGAAATAAGAGGGGAAAAAAAGQVVPAADDDKMSEHITCGICQEVLYKVVSTIPCLHNFCAACASDCLKRSSECPICRTEITEVRRNHDLAKLVDTYLAANPAKQRSAEELAELDARTTITDESLRVSKKRAAPDGGAHDRDDEQYSDDYSDDYDDYGGGGGFGGSGLGAALGRLMPQMMRAGPPPPPPPHIKCPNCPVPGAPPQPGVFTCPAADPSNQPGGGMAAMLGMVRVDSNHVQCAACSAQLPKRAAPPVPTRCQFCAQTLCDAYKRSPDCVPPGFPTLGSANACQAGPMGKLRPISEHEIALPLQPPCAQPPLLCVLSGACC